MMEVIDADYMNLVHRNNISSALSSLVTPPRRTSKSSRRMSYNPEEFYFLKTPPATKNPPLDSLSRSLPKSSATSRCSPSRLSPGQLNVKGGFYAGAKFGERPSPADLPKPPNHWVDSFLAEEQSCMEMTHSLKVLLKVQA